MRFLFPLLAGTVACFSGTMGQADSPSAPPLPTSCEVIDSSVIIHVVFCDGSFSSAELAHVGQAACKEALPCGTWIYLDRTNMPNTAPENHNGLSPDQVVAATAVWVAEDKNLIEITKAQ